MLFLIYLFISFFFCNQEVAERWRTKAAEEKASRSYKRAKELYLLTLECDDGSDEDFRYSILEQLVDVQFKLKAFTEAIEHGQECYRRKDAPSKVFYRSGAVMFKCYFRPKWQE